MKWFKTLTPFVLLLIIGVISFRFLFFISYIKSQKANFRTQLLNEGTTTVKKIVFQNALLFVNANGYEWKEHNKELVIDGVYHEVISLQKENGVTIVSLVEDKTENDLFKQFFCKNKSIHSDFADLIKILLNLIFTEAQNVTAVNSSAFGASFISEKIQFSEFNFYLKIIKPPQA